jgi:hypothetical protein
MVLIGVGEHTGLELIFVHLHHGEGISDPIEVVCFIDFLNHNQLVEVLLDVELDRKHI